MQRTEANDLDSSLPKQVKIVFVIKRERMIGRNTNPNPIAMQRTSAGRTRNVGNLQTALQAEQRVKIKILLCQSGKRIDRGIFATLHYLCSPVEPKVPFRNCNRRLTRQPAKNLGSAR